MHGWVAAVGWSAHQTLTTVFLPDGPQGAGYPPKFAKDAVIEAIDAGDRVRWRNEDADDHTATARDDSFDTGTLSENESATEQFDDEGTFRYNGAAWYNAATNAQPRTPSVR